MSQPGYIVNKIIGQPDSGFPYTLKTNGGIEMVVHTNGSGNIGFDEVLLDGNVNLKSSSGDPDSLTLTSNGDHSKYHSSNITDSTGYIPITSTGFGILGDWSNGRYRITDFSSDFNANLYVESVQGVINSQVKIKRARQGFCEVTIGPATTPSSGQFYLSIQGTPITNSISYTDSDNILELIIDNFVSPYDTTWFTNHVGIIYVGIPKDLDPNTFSGISIDLSVVDGNPAPVSAGIFNIYNYTLNNAIWDYMGSNNLLLEWDSHNNRASNYNMTFPFNDPKNYDNDFSQDGGSNYQNSNITLQACNIKGYSYLNAQGSYCTLGVNLSNQIFLDVSALKNQELVSGDFIGRPDQFDGVYLSAGFLGSIDLNAGRSTLQNTFTVGDYWIDADDSQSLHWTGEIYIDNTNENTLWEIRNVQYLPDYFKIVVQPGQGVFFGQGNWATTYFPSTPVTDPFLIGSAGHGGEISFWREKGPTGGYTSNILAYNVVLDYFYD